MSVIINPQLYILYLDRVSGDRLLFGIRVGVAPDVVDQEWKTVAALALRGYKHLGDPVETENTPNVLTLYFVPPRGLPSGSRHGFVGTTLGSLHQAFGCESIRAHNGPLWCQKPVMGPFTPIGEARAGEACGEPAPEVGQMKFAEPETYLRTVNINGNFFAYRRFGTVSEASAYEAKARASSMVLEASTISRGGFHEVVLRMLPCFSRRPRSVLAAALQFDEKRIYADGDRVLYRAGPTLKIATVTHGTGKLRLHGAGLEPHIGVKLKYSHETLVIPSRLVTPAVDGG